MPHADEVRGSLAARIEELEAQLRDLRAARAALTAGERGVATKAYSRRRGGRDVAFGRGAQGEGLPSSVVRVLERWDAQGRPAQAAAVWQRDRWITAMPEHARALEALPDRLDGLIVRQLVLEKPWTAPGMFEPMIVVYAWGWSTTPVGVKRSQSALVAGVEQLGASLLAAREAMRRAVQSTATRRSRAHTASGGSVRFRVEVPVLHLTRGPTRPDP
jgi:hypothetical protein